MKRFLCVILAVLLILPILTSCGNQKYFDSPELKEYMKQFKNNEPGIPINKIYEVYNAKDKKIAKFEAGNTPILIDNGVIFYRYIYDIKNPYDFLVTSQRKVEFYYQNFKNGKIKKLDFIPNFASIGNRSCAYKDGKVYLILYTYEMGGSKNRVPYLYCFDLNSGESNSVSISATDNFNCSLRLFDDKLFVYDGGKNEFIVYDLSLKETDFTFPNLTNIKGISSDNDYLYLLTNEDDSFIVTTIEKRGNIKETEDVTEKIKKLFSSKQQLKNYKNNSSPNIFIKTKDYFGFGFTYPSELLKGEEEILNEKNDRVDVVYQLSQYFDNAVLSCDGIYTLVNFETDEIVNISSTKETEDSYTDLHAYNDNILIYSFINYKDNQVPIKLYYLSFDNLK